MSLEWFNIFGVWLFINYFLIRERREISHHLTGVDENSSVQAAGAILNDMLIRIQICLDRLYESEDVILNHGSDQRVIVEKQVKVKYCDMFKELYDDKRFDHAKFGS